MNDAHDPVFAELSVLLEQQEDLLLAVLFGSVARGTAQPDSDVDIAVLGPRALDVRRRQELIDAIAQVTGRPVDLVDLRLAGVALLRAVLTEGRRLFCKDETAWLHLLSRMVTDAEDFLPAQEQLLRERRERWLR